MRTLFVDAVNFVVHFFYRMPNGLPDVSSYPELFAELLRDPSWSLKDLKKLAGLNFLRVFKKIAEVGGAF